VVGERSARRGSGLGDRRRAKEERSEQGAGEEQDGEGTGTERARPEREDGYSEDDVHPGGDDHARQRVHSLGATIVELSGKGRTIRQGSQPL
jgi:hypothetical protein